MIKKEVHLYRHLQRWLRRRGYTVKDKWVNKGQDKFRVDVIGVKNTGSQHQDDIEIVAIEAKIGGNFQSLGQTENYRDFAHRVYFATTDKHMTERFQPDCFRKRLGFLLIDKRSGKVKELVGAPVILPRSEAQMVDFLRKIYVGRCSLCGCYFDLEKEWQETKWLPRYTQFSKPAVKISRYVCKSCKSDMFRHFEDDLGRLRSRLEKRDRQVDGRIERVSVRLRRSKR